MNVSANAIDRLSGRVAFALAAGTVLLVILVGWFIFVSPKRAKAAELGRQLSDAQTQLIETQRFLASPAARNSARDLKKLDRALPAEPRMSEILRQLTRASQAAGVRIEGITPGAMVSTPSGQAIPITVAARGHYFRLQKFVHLLRSAALVGESLHVSGRLLAVDSIQFSNSSSGSSGSSTSDGNGPISATLAVNAFVSGGAAAAPPTGSATTSTTTP